MGAVATAWAVALTPAQGHAQSDRSATRTPGKPQTNAAASQTSAVSPGETRRWSLDDALPTNSPAAQSRDAKPASPAKSYVSKANPAKPDLGRLPLSGGAGSFGVETETKLKSTEFPDGRRVPGVDSSRHQPPSYFGLSISMPTEK